MSRLTEKYYAIKTQRCNGKTQQVQMFANVYNKLSQLEDIEDEIGIDLITLFKAYNNGIWCKLENGKIEHCQSYISNRSYGFVCIEQEYISYYEVFLGNMRKEMNFNLKDYGKTWSLDKSDLEKKDD